MGSTCSPQRRRPERVIARGERVFLRRPTRRDEAEFLALRRASWSFLAPWEAEIEGLDPLGPARFSRFLRRGRGRRRERWLVCRTEDGALAGALSLSQNESGAARSATVGYWIGVQFARRGYMSEALSLALAHAFRRLGLERVEAYVLPENTASKGLLAKLGFVQRELVPAYRVLHGQARDHERWTLNAPSRAGSGSPG